MVRSGQCILYLYTLIRSSSREVLLGGLYVPGLNFKPSHVAILEGSHIAVGILCSGLSFVVISARSCRLFRAVSPVGIYPNRASLEANWEEERDSVSCLEISY